MSMSITYKSSKTMNDPSGIQYSKPDIPPPTPNACRVTHVESLGTHKWATVIVEEALSEQRKDITHLKLNWKSDSHLSDFGPFFSVPSALPTCETNVVRKSL